MIARQETILALARQQGRVLVDDLARRLSITPQTVRKDLRLLEEEGLVTRFHGGASLRAGSAYLDYGTRAGIAAREKQAIGAAAAAMLRPGQTVFLNAGTTTEAAARAMGQVAGLTVIADSVNIANITRQIPGLTTIVAGGVVRPADGSVVGAGAVSFIGQFSADVALIGAAAVGPDGTLMDYDLDQVMVARAMMQHARRVVLLVDGAKFDASAPVRIAPLGELSAIVTDICPSATVRAACAAAGVELVELKRESEVAARSA
ncbi:DeoR/GlpR transcriptional regulator [Halovulum dunhuangense]|uniref:DeoR/GlpR transcriptional regulator n=1 Tax=Halovulum dunhuangense TaxID=1505036 RepID=A0A849L3X2_9RHOB|nr:DeoR/GlpR transcriptional regulator [Halovulum dunhuangense]